MICESCGHDNPKGSRFCEKCGQQIDMPSRPAAAAEASKPAFKEPSSQPVPDGLKYFPEDAPPGIGEVLSRLWNGVLLNVRERLPALGGLLVLVGFFIPWVKTGGGNGLFYIIQGVQGLERLSGIKDMTSLGANNLLFIELVALGLLLVPIAGLVGLLSLTGTHRIRTAGVTMATMALVDLYLFFFSFLFGKIGVLISDAGAGVWIITAGLLWMIVSPMFAPPEE
jgi:hypothetical protein